MLRLFGSPGQAFLDAYEERFPLAPGHEERVELYQLFPLLVHAALFGGGYPRSAPSASRAGTPDGGSPTRSASGRDGRTAPAHYTNVQWRRGQFS